MDLAIYGIVTVAFALLILIYLLVCKRTVKDNEFAQAMHDRYNERTSLMNKLLDERNLYLKREKLFIDWINILLGIRARGDAPLNVLPSDEPEKKE